MPGSQLPRAELCCLSHALTGFKNLNRLRLGKGVDSAFLVWMTARCLSEAPRARRGYLSALDGTGICGHRVAFRC